MTEDDELDSYQDQYLDQVWDDFVISGNPVHLAKYIEGGGDIGDDILLRKYLSYVLRGYAPKPRGSSDRVRDVQVYLKVQWWLSTYRNHLPPKKKRPLLQEAYRHFTFDDPDAKDAFQKQYERGRKIMSPTNKE